MHCSDGHSSGAMADRGEIPNFLVRPKILSKQGLIWDRCSSPLPHRFYAGSASIFESHPLSS